MPCMAPKKSASQRVKQHSVKLPPALETRVRHCMEIEGLASFADFVRSALTRRCRQIEQEHALDAEGRPVKGTG